MLKWYELLSGKAGQATATRNRMGEQENRESEKIFKIIVLGMPEKTAFIRKYTSGVFAEDIKMTLGADFSIKKLEVDGTPITLRIWDFASEDRFKLTRPAYIKGSDGAIIMNDVMDAKALKNLSEFIETIKKNAGDIPIFFSIPKLSSKAEERIDFNEGYTLNEITSEIGPNGEHAFELLTKKMLEPIE